MKLQAPLPAATKRMRHHRLMGSCRSVVIVNEYAKVSGGASRVALSSALALVRKGVQVHLFASIGPADPMLEDAGIEVTLLDRPPYSRDPQRVRGALTGLWDRGAATRFRGLLGKLDPSHTVVHAHTFRDALSASVPDAAISLGFPTIFTAHEYTLGCPYGGFFDYRKNCICPHRGLSLACLKTRCNTGSYTKKLWHYAAQFEFARIARIPDRLSHVVFVSQASGEILRPYLPPGMRTSVVPNPIDFKVSEGSMMSETSPFLFVGYLAAHKDPLTPARAARELDVPVTFVGEGPLEEEIARINPDAVLTGWLPGDHVAQQMRSARALIFASIGHETQGLTVMEAAASGLSSIVSDKCVTGYQIQELGSGALYKGGDKDDLMRAMTRYADIAFARDEGERARQACMRLDRSTDTFASQLLTIYEDELARVE